MIPVHRLAENDTNCQNKIRIIDLVDCSLQDNLHSPAIPGKSIPFVDGNTKFLFQIGYPLTHIGVPSSHFANIRKAEIGSNFRFADRSSLEITTHCFSIAVTVNAPPRPASDGGEP